MAIERCSNQNHTKMNVVVRFCSSCGEVVNKKIPNTHCGNEDHAKYRKNGNHFCVNCGKDLKASF